MDDWAEQHIENRVSRINWAGAAGLLGLIVSGCIVLAGIIGLVSLAWELSQ